MNSLYYANLSFNNIKSIDLSHATNLTYAVFNNNDLSTLNIKNGNNSSIAMFDITTSNPSLQCIEVDELHSLVCHGPL